MRILVCGGRNYPDLKRMEQVLGEFAPADSVLITGGAQGADELAAFVAKRLGWANIETYMADWPTFGRRAGPIRNRIMLKEGRPDLVIAFPGGPGTGHMIETARKAGVKVRTVEPLTPAAVVALQAILDLPAFKETEPKE